MKLRKESGILKKIKILLLIYLYCFFIPNQSLADIITIAVRAHSGIENAISRWQPTIDYLQQSIPEHDFILLPLTGILEMEEKIKANMVDFVITQPVAYVDLENMYSVTRMLTLQKKYGAQYGSVIFAKSNREDIKSLYDIKNKKIGGVTPKGFGGWLIGYNEILSKGVDAYEDCESVSYLGSHENVVNAVVSGTIDVGVARTGIIEKMFKNNELSPSDIKILHKQNLLDFPLLLSSKLYPEWAFAKTTRISRSVSKKIVIVLLKLSPDHIATQKGQYQQWTIPLSYQPVHDLMQKFNIGSYSEYGKVSFTEFISKYAIALIIFLIFFSGTILLIIKVTILKKSEQNLADEQERLFITLRCIGDGVITTDTKGKIVLINKVTEKLTGWTQQAAEGKPIEEVFNIVNEKTGKLCENPVTKVLATNQTVALDNHTVLIARDDTRYIIEDSGAPIFNQENKIIGIVLVYRDVTKERKTAEELLKVKKLESVGILAGGIAHDFNNILAAILGNIELAERHIDPTDKAYFLLEESKKASIRAKDLTQQLLTFAKGGTPVKQKLSISNIISDSANFVLHGSSVVCHYEIPEDLWQVDVDTGQISQVIQNIIINARHAMSKGGVIEVCCINITDPNEEVEELLTQKYIKITISDSGCGIPAKLVKKIFDPYFSTKQEGSGLGLAICQSIINKHDGFISVLSEIDKGTTFTIYLPAFTEVMVDTSIKQTRTSNIDYHATIMVMDDDPMIRNLTEEMLTAHGHQVLLVENGDEAIKLYNDYYKSKRTIDIIIMDLTIPGGMGGKEAVQGILKLNPQAKVIASSGYANDPIMAHYQDYGFIASMPKPYQTTELIQLITKHLS